MTFTVEVDLSRALRKIEIAKAQIPFAASLALNRTASAVKLDLQRLEEAQFKNVRRYTRNSLAVERSSKSNLNARVYIRSASVEQALKTEVFGGQRDRSIEKLLKNIIPAGMYAVPAAAAKRGADTKVSLGWLRQIVSQLGAASNESVKPIRRRKTIANLGYFFLTQKRGLLFPGVYQRKANHSVTALIHFVTHTKYSPRLASWFTTAENSARANFPREFRDASRRAMATAR